MHHRKCRWHMFCNGRTAIVMYLARPDTLFVSDVIRHDAGKRVEALTIVLALLALIIIPVDQRPTCTFGNDALTFHPDAIKVSRMKRAGGLPSPSSSPARSDFPLSSPQRSA